MKIQVECIVFRKNNGKYEFLLLKRTKEKGGFWQPPSGAMEPSDKSIIDAAHRELFEEIGIEKKEIVRIIENVHDFEINKHYLTGQPIPTIKEYVFGIEITPDAPILIHKNPDKEHEQHEWMPFELALEKLKWENNKDAFRRLGDMLKQDKAFSRKDGNNK